MGDCYGMSPVEEYRATHPEPHEHLASAAHAHPSRRAVEVADGLDPRSDYTTRRDLVEAVFLLRERFRALSRSLGRSAIAAESPEPGKDGDLLAPRRDEIIKWMGYGGEDGDAERAVNVLGDMCLRLLAHPTT